MTLLFFINYLTDHIWNKESVHIVSAVTKYFAIFTVFVLENYDLWSVKFLLSMLGRRNTEDSMEATSLPFSFFNPSYALLERWKPLLKTHITIVMLSTNGEGMKRVERVVYIQDYFLYHVILHFASCFIHVCSVWICYKEYILHS